MIKDRRDPYFLINHSIEAAMGVGFPIFLLAIAKNVPNRDDSPYD
jgi:hypothetical protein